MAETCPSTRWADAGGGSCTDTPRGEAVGAAWDLTESVSLMREASRRGFARDRVLERSARRVFTRRSVALCGERRGVGWATLGYHSGRNARGMRRDQSSPGHFHKFMTESLPLCPLLGGGAAKGGYLPDWIGGALPWKKGGIPADSGLGTGYPDGREGGNRSEPWNHDPPRYTLTPD
jgi:hypothetical protein